ncbi:MAG TPA: site-2 protease family protein [Candidatus Heimdallarchaeota archaeon]|nr:site-2 protease family protein [Candidatus Heimdallarchaeota archaeon]
MNIGDFLNIALSLVAVFAAIVFHEVSHGYVAYRLGDPTPKVRGRLTLNPLAHVDLIGTILVPLALVVMGSRFLFGWAKPVPINPNYFRKPFKGMLYVAIAGPVTNLTLALVIAGVGRLTLGAIPNSLLFYGQTFGAYLLQAIFYLLGFFVIINVVLAVFNMIPIPPLDGSRVLTYFLPPEGKRIMLTLERYGFLILLALILLGGVSGLLNLTSGLWRGLLGIRWLAALAS